jgi:hypothetical protein
MKGELFEQKDKALRNGFFEKYNKNCPSHQNGECRLQVHYNQNVNDPRYLKCKEPNCPVFFWSMHFFFTTFNILVGKDEDE